MNTTWNCEHRSSNNLSGISKTEKKTHAKSFKSGELREYATIREEW